MNLLRKKLVIQQQKELLDSLRQQLGLVKEKKYKHKKDRKYKNDPEDREERVKNGRVEKCDRKKIEKKFRNEKRKGKYGGKGTFSKGRRHAKHENSSDSSSAEGENENF